MYRNLILALLLAFTLTACSPKASSTTSSNTNKVLGESSTQLAKYTLDQIAQHNTKNDCWMVIDQNVYDVTSFVSQHPGGPRILQGCGQDATQLFTSQRKHNNSNTQQLLQKFIIGQLTH